MDGETFFKDFHNKTFFQRARCNNGLWDGD